MDTTEPHQCAEGRASGMDFKGPANPWAYHAQLFVHVNDVLVRAPDFTSLTGLYRPIKVKNHTSRHTCLLHTRPVPLAVLS